MKFFFDTADVREVREAASRGFVDGVTTNHPRSQAGLKSVADHLRVRQGAATLLTCAG